MASLNKLGPDLCPPEISPETWRLFCAAANGELERVQSTINATPALMHEFIWYECPLHYAVRENQVEVVRTLLKAGVNPAYSNFTYSSWQKLLPIAKDRGFDEIHAMLVTEMRQRFNYAPSYEPLWTAIVKGNTDEVTKLIKEDAKLVNSGDEHGNRAIHWAILTRRIPIIQILLEAGADINAKRADMQSPLHLALEGSDYWFRKKHEPDPDTTALQVADHLRENGANYEFTDAIAFNDLEHVSSVLATSPDLAKQLDDSRRSPLYIAAAPDQMDMVRLLLQHGAEPNLPEHCAPTGRALFRASSRTDIEMMKLLIEHEANADAYVDSCGNCLSIAQLAGEREAEATALLKRHGALPGEWELDSHEKVSAALDDESFVPNRDMWSNVLGKIFELDAVDLLKKYVARFGPSSIRSMNPAKGWRLPNSDAMMSECMSLGTDINARDWFGRTFLHYAAFDETPDRAAWLLLKGANIDTIDHESGTTPLGLAAWNGNTAMADFLLKAGANASLPTNATWAQPLSFAKTQGHSDIVKRLEEE